MAAKNIKVTPEKLKSVAEEIRECASTYESEYNSIMETVDEMDAAWDGESSVQFINKIKGFKLDLQKMKNDMVEYADYLDESANAYTQAEEANQQQFNALKGKAD